MYIFCFKKFKKKFPACHASFVSDVPHATVGPSAPQLYPTPASELRQLIITGKSETKIGFLVLITNSQDLQKKSILFMFGQINANEIRNG